MSLCHLTGIGDYDPDPLTWLYNKVSLHNIDTTSTASGAA